MRLDLGNKYRKWITKNGWQAFVYMQITYKLIETKSDTFCKCCIWFELPIDVADLIDLLNLLLSLKAITGKGVDREKSFSRAFMQINVSFYNLQENKKRCKTAAAFRTSKMSYSCHLLETEKHSFVHFVSSKYQQICDPWLLVCEPQLFTICSYIPQLIKQSKNELVGKHFILLGL